MTLHRSTRDHPKTEGWTIVARAVLTGSAVVMAGTIPRNLFYAANLRYWSSVPWAVPLTALFIGFFWWYLQGGGPPASTAMERRTRLRANRVSGRLWAWSLFAGGLAIVALVLALRVVNRMVMLPKQEIPDLSGTSPVTVGSLLVLAAPVAGIIEEAAFRGYMQRPIERRYGVAMAILITGTMFALVHLDFTLVLWPYYVAVAAIYGVVAYLTDSILPAVVLHTGGNLYSNFELWLRGQAEWQTAASPAELIWATGADRAFWLAVASTFAVLALSLWAYVKLANAAKAVRM